MNHQRATGLENIDLVIGGREGILQPDVTAGIVKTGKNDWSCLANLGKASRRRNA